MASIIINLNGLKKLTAEALVNKSAEIMGKVENYAFTVAVYGAYATGTAIPAEKRENGEIRYIRIKSSIEQQEFANNVGKSAPTISRWIKAVKYIIEAGYDMFTAFNNGEIKFTFDKIIALYGNKVISAEDSVDTLKTYMAKTCDEIKNLIKGEDIHNTKEAKTPSADGKNDSKEEKASGKMVTFTYAGKDYTVDETYIKAFISKYAKVK